MSSRALFCLFWTAGCIPDPADYSGTDDPRRDYDRDGQTEEDGDCAPNDPFVWGGAPEYCDGKDNGCSGATWSAAAEEGVATWIDSTGLPTDITGAWFTGTEASPAEVHITEPGTLRVCSGTQYATVHVEAAGVSIEGFASIPDVPPTLSGAEAVPVLVVDAPNGVTTISDLTLADGHFADSQPAGGISQHAGELIVTDSTLTGHVGDEGGALHIGGHTTLARVRITESHTPYESPGGGGVFVAPGATLEADALDVVGCFSFTVEDRDADSATKGGGLYNQGTTSVRRSTFDNNQSTLGAGLSNTSELHIEDSTIRDCISSQGGGLWTGPDSITHVQGVTMSGNASSFSGDGGGIYNQGTLTIDTSDLVDNYATNNGGGVYNDTSGTITATEVLVSTNFATSGGNISDRGVSSWTDGAIMGGVAHNGGGVFTFEGGHTTLHHVAIWSNRVRLPDPDDDSNFGLGGGGLLVFGGTITCTADDSFIGPDHLTKAPVIASNRSERHPVGGVMLMVEYVINESNFTSDGCIFGAGDRANTPIQLAADLGGKYYDVAGLEVAIDCTREECLCDGEPCPEVVLDE